MTKTGERLTLSPPTGFPGSKPAALRLASPDLAPSGSAVTHSAGDRLTPRSLALYRRTVSTREDVYRFDLPSSILSGARINNAFALQRHFGRPRPGSKRAPYRIGKSREYKAAMMAIATRCIERPRDLFPRIEDGPVEAWICIHWGRRHRDGCARGLAFLDVDAVAKCVLDAVVKARWIEDDSQVSKLTISKHYNRRTGLEIAIRPTHETN